jgi:hypothetical protein
MILFHFTESVQSRTIGKEDHGHGRGHHKKDSHEDTNNTHQVYATVPQRTHCAPDVCTAQVHVLVLGC